MRILLFVTILLAFLASALCRSMQDAEDNEEFVSFMKKVKAHYEQMTPRQKRQASTSCPYCAPDVWMVYPDWDDCTGFFSCYGGTITKINCNAMLADTSKIYYFNPTNKVCEPGQNPSNSCIFRSFNLFTA